MAAGDAQFNKLLKENGGYVVDDKYIKYILDLPLPDGYELLCDINDIKMKFSLDGEKLKTAIRIIVYETAGYNYFAARCIKIINFNLKNYKAASKRNDSKVYYIDGKPYIRSEIILLEI